MNIARRAANRLCVGLITTLPLVGTAAVLCVAPCVAQAQDDTSKIAGVGIPKGGKRISDASLVSGMGRYIADGIAEFKLPAHAGGPGTPEIYFWTDSAYKEGRSLFMQTVLKSNLTAAGYSYKAVDPHSETIPNIFKQDEYNSGTLDPNPWDAQPAFFYGSNAQGKTITGVWLDQKSSKRLVLVLAEAGTADAPTETKIPTITDSNVWLIKDFKNATKGMPPPPMPSFQKIAVKPGTVRGQVKDGSGKPIAGAHMVAWSSAAGGFRTLHKATTNAQGMYEIILPVGICKMDSADCQVTYNDETLNLPLHPVDGEKDEFSSQEGHVENFVLRTSGASGMEGNGNYGGTVRLNTWDAPMGSTVEVTLTPSGTLVDGTKGKTFVFRYPIKTTFPETIVDGIPIGRYTLTAKLYDGDDALPLQARKTFVDSPGDENPTGPSLVVDFTSKGMVVLQGRSGVRRFEVTLKP